MCICEKTWLSKGKNIFQSLQELLHNIHVCQSVVWFVSLNYVQSTQHPSGISFKFSDLWFLQESVLILFCTDPE